MVVGEGGNPVDVREVVGGAELREHQRPVRLRGLLVGVPERHRLRGRAIRRAGGEAVVVEAEPRSRPDRRQVGLGAEVEDDVRLLPDDVAAIDRADRPGALARHRGQRPLIELRAAGRLCARRPLASGPGLVQQVVAEHPIRASEGARDVLPRAGVLVQELHPAHLVVRPEVVEGPP